MTLDDLECLNKGSLCIFWRFWAARHISTANCAETNWDRHRQAAYKLLTLNVDFDGPSLDVLSSRKPAHKGIKERYPRKSRYFTVVGQQLLQAFARLVSISSNFLFVVDTRYGENVWSNGTRKSDLTTLNFLIKLFKTNSIELIKLRPAKFMRLSTSILIEKITQSF